jgi:probable phosphoglycerate mutase
VAHFLYLVRHGEASPHDGQLSEAGQEQARLTGQRLKEVPLNAIHHGPLARAAQTAAIIAEGFPSAPLSATDLAGDYIPSDPASAELPSPFASLVSGYTPAERAEGSRLARDAIERFTKADDDGSDTHELIVTHNFLIAWFVSHAMLAPSWRWLGLNQMNGGLTVIVYYPTSPPRLISFNDAGHLPPRLRWTGFPLPLTPLSG